MDPELSAAFDGLRQQIQDSAEETRRYVDDSVQKSAEETRRYVDDSVQKSAEETRRHFDVTAENLRSQIEVVAEGLAVQSDRIDRLEASFGQRLDDAVAEIGSMMRLSYGQLEQRLVALEGHVSELKERQSGFEARLERLESPPSHS